MMTKTSEVNNFKHVGRLAELIVIMSEEHDKERYELEIEGGNGEKVWLFYRKNCHLTYTIKGGEKKDGRERDDTIEIFSSKIGDEIGKNMIKLYPKNNLRTQHTLSAKLTTEDTELLQSISTQFTKMKQLIDALDGKLTNIKRSVIENGLRLEYLEANNRPF